MRRTLIASLAMCGLAATGVVVARPERDEPDDLLYDDGIDHGRKVPVPRPAPRPRSVPAPAKEHKHAREIARRLRQEARAAAKRGG